MQRHTLLAILVLFTLVYGQETPISPVDAGEMDSLFFEIYSDTTLSNVSENPYTDELFADTSSVDSDFFEFASDSTQSDSSDFENFLDHTDLSIQDSLETDEESDLESFLLKEEPGASIGSQLIGYTAGLDMGFPFYRYGGLGLSFENSGLPIGLTVTSPFGRHIGPFDVGLGFQIGNYSFQNKVTGELIGGLYVLATANTSVYKTAHGTISTQAGAGYFGRSFGLTLGAAYVYALPNFPLVLRPYIRVNSTLDSGVITSDGTPSYTWLNIGLMSSYDLSVLSYQIASTPQYKNFIIKIKDLLNR